MKNFVFILSVLVFCHAFSQRKPKIKGNKNVVEMTESLPAFTAIELKYDLDIRLQKANEEGYALVIDDNLIDVLKFEVENNTLVISSFYKITSKKKLDITVKYRELSSITLRDGRVQMDEVLEADELTINTYASSKLQLSANASLMNLTMHDNSAADLSLESDTLNVSLKDRVDVKIYTRSERNNIEMNANASAKIEGTAYAMSATLYDNSNLKARNLEAEGVEIIADGSPNARVSANKFFELTSKGSAKTYLSGDAKIEILEFLNTSELHKEK